MTMTMTTTINTNYGMFEDANDRNATFEEKEYLINNLMYRKASMMRAAHMDEEDVRQELSVRLLELLDTYDPQRCSNLDAYLTEQLKYHIINLRRASKLTGMPGAPRDGVDMVSLNQENRFGFCLEIPVENKSSSVAWVEKEIAALPEEQQDALDRLLSGIRVHPRNKALCAARLQLKSRLFDRQIQFAL